MPLDPFFADRLRVHRRYLLARWWRSLVDRWRPAAASSTASSRATPGKAGATASRSARLRARHRRAALAWDRTEFATVALPGPATVVGERTVDVPGRPAVRIRIHRPPASAGRILPAALTFYGGAFRIGGIDYPTTDALVRSRSVGADIAMIAVDYALAPEHRFPTPVDQGVAVLDWVIHHATELGIDPARLAVAGTSAGADIAAAVALRARDEGRARLRLQVLEVPVLDLTGRGIDFGVTWSMGVPAFVVARELRSVARTYLARPGDARSPFASPLRAGDLSGLPPAVVLTAQYDPLRRQGSRYAARLRAAGVQASAVQYEGMTHDAPIFTRALLGARRWNADVIAALATLHDD